MEKFKIVLTLLFFTSCLSNTETIVLTDGFNVDKSLIDRVFNNYDFKINGYSKVIRFTEINGVQNYVLNPTPATSINDVDTMGLMVDRFYTYETPEKIQYSVNLYKELEVGTSCLIKIKTYNLNALESKNDTLLISGEVLINNYSDVESHNNTFLPDSSCLLFNKIPYSGDTVIGFVYASRKNLHIEGTFKIILD